jgi:hypothetical protein
MRRISGVLAGIAFLAAATCGRRRAAGACSGAWWRKIRACPAGHPGRGKTTGEARRPSSRGRRQDIEREAFELLARDEDRLVADYISQHGKVVNTDDARELFAAYRADRSRAAAVHEPSTELSRKVYARLLDESRGKVKEVLFLASDGGSGKTTALNALLARGGARGLHRCRREARGRPARELAGDRPFRWAR